MTSPSTDSEPDAYFVCPHGEVAAWCIPCEKLHGGRRRKNEEDFTVKALVDFYDTLEAVKCLPPDIRKARTIARIEAERVSRLQKQWKELSEKVFNSRPRESLIAFPVPEGHVQSLRDTINSYSQPNSPNPSHTINTTPIKKKVLKVSRTSDDFRDFTSSPAFTGNVRDDSRTGLSSLDMIVPEEAEEEKKRRKKNYNTYCSAWRKNRSYRRKMD